MCIFVTHKFTNYFLSPQGFMTSTIMSLWLGFVYIVPKYYCFLINYNFKTQSKRIQTLFLLAFCREIQHIYLPHIIQPYYYLIYHETEGINMVLHSFYNNHIELIKTLNSEQLPYELNVAIYSH